MPTHEIIAPSYRALRPHRAQPTSDTFPVYKDLADKLANAREHPDATVRHVLATLAAYAYSDQETIAMIAARLGLEENRCLKIAQDVDAMFIRSTAYLLQSKDGRVAILCYRGTEPINMINWFTDADVSPEKMSFPAAAEGGPSFAVHAGFYRNVRSTRFKILDVLQSAIDGDSILRSVPAELGSKRQPLEALYITGHSLGGAMAAMMGTMLLKEKALAPFAEKLRAIYTYGQPMIGDQALANECTQAPLFRYIYERDVVPELPPRATGEFAHFGREWRYRKGDWSESATPTHQMRNILELPSAFAVLITHQIRLLRDLPFLHSIYDHEPQHYIMAVTPPGVHSEYGD